MTRIKCLILLLAIILISDQVLAQRLRGSTAREQALYKILDEYEAKNKELNEQNEALKDQLQKQEQKIQQLLRNRKASEKKLNKKLSEALKRYYDTEKELEIARNEIADLKTKIDNHYKQYQQDYDNNPQLKQDLDDTQDQVSAVEIHNNNQITIINNYTTYLQNNYTSINVLIQEAKSAAQSPVFGGGRSTFERRRLNYTSLGTGVGIDYGGVGLGLQFRFGGKSGVGFHLAGGTLGDGIYGGGGLKFFYYRGGFVDISYLSNLYDIDICESCSRFNQVIAATVGWDIYFNRRFGLRYALGGILLEDDTSTRELSGMGTLGFNYKF